MCFVLQWFQFITLLFFHFFFEHINNNDQNISTFSSIIVTIKNGAISL